eukprot:TRINITY_DN7839_c1_g1_i1.p1 TRINITY_DN7839_c1_g1~~TRINITY_DN7839_c1_g1_i1.p1  ORF type:complete len:291 (-),score=33.82 TRINITY_DN7839_c1_g1_i1:275-1087(-)
MDSMTKCRVCMGSGLLLADICPLCDGIAGWPSESPSIVEMNLDPKRRSYGLFRDIRAIHDSETVRVYQAYNATIADAAVAANSFRAPMEIGAWSPTRISWIKPSAVWMAYRCGWTIMKDENQERVLALDISRKRLERLLLEARLSHGGAPGECKKYPVVVQWDPERFMRGPQVLTSDVKWMRSVQIGIKGHAMAERTFLDPGFVLKITDVTESFRRAHSALTGSAPDVQAACDALWPERQEERLLVPVQLRAVLEMDRDDGPEHGRPVPR